MAGKSRPDDPLLHEIGSVRFVDVFEIVGVALELLFEKRVGIVDRLAAVLVKLEDLGQLCECIRTRLPAAGEPGLEIFGGDTLVALGIELYAPVRSLRVALAMWVRIVRIRL
ncbi:hypothetical protein NDI89_08245 [Natrinema sp. S1CR25-10]|uniref:Uncharacterized protein n=1 Tax=Natrinema salsiterrestre TaxID=2950540 RepID=A0A9Q4Q1J9_9EURY|nr:hypothetical protein [Natrinema salsiterrestre]